MIRPCPGIRAGPSLPSQNKTDFFVSRLARAVLSVSAPFAGIVAAAETTWRPFPEKMMTAWGCGVQPDNAWREYPCPQFERADGQNRDGLWDYAISAKDAAVPEMGSGKILVPSAVESALSGVGQLLAPDQALWDRRTLRRGPKAGHRTLLNL